jgi:hypothetical protein
MKFGKERKDRKEESGKPSSVIFFHSSSGKETCPVLICPKRVFLSSSENGNEPKLEWVRFQNYKHQIIVTEKIETNQQA